MQAYQSIVELLDSKKIKYSIYTHKHSPTVYDAKHNTRFDINFCLKTIAFKIKDKFVFVCLHAEDSIDYSKLSKAFNVSRNTIVKADICELRSVLGFEDGGISPISLREDSEIVFSNKIVKDSIVYCGAGKSDRTLEVKANDIIKLKNTRILDIVKNK